MGTPGTVRITFEPSGRWVDVPAGTRLFDAAHRAGLPVATSCQAEGVCARCGLRILRGGASLSPEGEDEARVKRAQGVPGALRLACLTTVHGPVTVTARYW